MRRFFNFVAGVVCGALVGSIAALLLAPVSGEELRQQASERAIEVRQDIIDAYEVRVAQLEAEIANLRKASSEEETS